MRPRDTNAFQHLERPFATHGNSEIPDEGFIQTVRCRKCWRKETGGVSKSAAFWGGLNYLSHQRGILGGKTGKNKVPTASSNLAVPVQGAAFQSPSLASTSFGSPPFFS